MIAVKKPTVESVYFDEGLFLMVAIMCAALPYFELFFTNAKYDAIFRINTDAPKARKIAFQRLGFPDTGIAVSFNILN